MDALNASIKSLLFGLAILSNDKCSGCSTNFSLFDVAVMGATMRLGQRKTVLRRFSSGEASLSSKLYGNVEEVTERHRHR